jgi:hypothetical protein
MPASARRAGIAEESETKGGAILPAFPKTDKAESPPPASLRQEQRVPPGTVLSQFPELRDA